MPALMRDRFPAGPRGITKGAVSTPDAVMRFFSSLSLSFKLPLVLSLVVAGVAASLGLVTIDRERIRLRHELRDKALFLSGVVAASAPEFLSRQDHAGLSRILRQVTADTDRASVTTAMVLDRDGRVLAHLYPALFPIGFSLASDDSPDRGWLQAALAMQRPGILEGPDFIEGVAPVSSDGTRLGVVRVQMSTFELERRIADDGFTVIVASIGIGTIGILLGGAWSIRTLRPLHELAQSMKDLAHGVTRRLPVLRKDEIGQLIASFNRMADELEEKRRMARQMAENEKVVALGRIAAGVAHEVNNPLAGMLNCLSTLRAKSNDPELVARYLPLIEKGLQRIEALVKDLLSELRVDDALDVGDPASLDHVRDLVAAEIDPARIEFVWDNQLQPGDTVNLAKMQQVLLNLLRNAIQAMPTGGRLLCRFQREAGQLVFEVEDTGQGIPASDVERIFDPFFTSRPTGTGLGLWIVLRLVTSMGGRVDVDSVSGQGTRFSIRIPKESTLATQSA